ncbi:unnamed protein product [Darwinula stevensoni]|uniref:Uncharacterized protein n=1 Tax=Darwinula stevensoni TaxID=69355 RepID=A0A7R9AA90_9CRUS|nr:unnamed protein product [Darwinula stevensoni]CAG0898204.1 unnamed protein product [Darwinula stevensoni]
MVHFLTHAPHRTPPNRTGTTPRPIGVCQGLSGTVRVRFETQTTIENPVPVGKMVRKGASIAPSVNGREADIRFQDEGEAVGVGPVTIRFLQRFSAHALGRSTYPDTSRFRRTIWLFIFFIATGYMTYEIIGILKAFTSGPVTTSTRVHHSELSHSGFMIQDELSTCITFNGDGDMNVKQKQEQGEKSSLNSRMGPSDGLQLILSSHVKWLIFGYNANGFRLIIHPPEIDHQEWDGKGFQINLGTTSYVTIKKMSLQRLPPDEGGDCAPNSFLEKRFHLDKKFKFTKQTCSFNFLFSENIATVNIYYESLAVETITEHLMYPWSSFIGTLGGLLGLYTGLSLISILEVLEWVLNIFLYGWRKPRTVAMGPKRRVVITGTDMENHEPELKDSLACTPSPYMETQNGGFDLGITQ